MLKLKLKLRLGNVAVAVAVAVPVPQFDGGTADAAGRAAQPDVENAEEEEDQDGAGEDGRHPDAHHEPVVDGGVVHHGLVVAVPAGATFAERQEQHQVAKEDCDGDEREDDELFVPDERCVGDGDAHEPERKVRGPAHQQVQRQHVVDVEVDHRDPVRARRTVRDEVEAVGDGAVALAAGGGVAVAGGGDGGGDGGGSGQGRRVGVGERVKVQLVLVPVDHPDAVARVPVLVPGRHVVEGFRRPATIVRVVGTRFGRVREHQDHHHHQRKPEERQEVPAEAGGEP